jgi:hypothetical protein
MLAVFEHVRDGMVTRLPFGIGSALVRYEKTVTHGISLAERSAHAKPGVG